MGHWVPQKSEDEINGLQQLKRKLGSIQEYQKRVNLMGFDGLGTFGSLGLL